MPNLFVCKKVVQICLELLANLKCSMFCVSVTYYLLNWMLIKSVGQIFISSPIEYSYMNIHSIIYKTVVMFSVFQR